MQQSKIEVVIVLNITMYEAEDLAKRAYTKQIWGKYDDAVALYTEALKRCPKDSRLLNNRCMCFMEKNDYKSALDDAENMTVLFPQNKKSYFRKGEVLMNLKKYMEAEKMFKNVLKLDAYCEVAKHRILEAQTMEICSRGKYPREKAERALRMSNSVQEAEYILESGKLDAIYSELEETMFCSDEEIDDRCVDGDPMMDPRNPFRSTSLWVGNLGKDVTEKKLNNLFGRFGCIESINIKGNYAFINFNDAIGPGVAMRNLQGTLLGNKYLRIKFPDSAWGRMY